MQLIRHFASRLFLVLCLVWAGAASATPMLLIDASTGEVLFEQEAGQPWHPASLTKLMTAFVAFQAVAEGRVALDTPVTLSKRAVNQAPSVSGLPVDSALTLKDALYIMIVKSANDVAFAIAETVGGTAENFVAEMNQTAQGMGLSATHFVNPNGLHDPAQVTSARDLAVLGLYIRQNFPAYQAMFETEAVTLGKANLESNNNLLTHFAGTNGMKTGYVCASGLNIVATVDRGGRTLMAVLLGNSSGRERGEMAAELFLRGFSGSAAPTGRNVFQISNLSTPPVDMRPLICGKEAKAYVAERETAFPMGMKGHPSYLNDEIERPVYVATNLGRVRNVPLPRLRPAYAPAAVALPDEVETAVLATDVSSGFDPRAPIPMPTLVR